MKPDFMLHLEATLSILSPCRTWLSLSPGPAEEAKPFWDATFRPTGRSTVEEHFAHLVASGRITDSAPAFLALSARNVLANLRCVGFIRGVTPQPVHALGDTLASARPFYILAGLRSGGLEIALWDGHTPVPDQYDWFVSGVPVVWDGIPPESMLPRIIAESADPSHLWHLPRGEHPEASTGNEERIRKICAVFQKMLASEAGPTAAAMSHQATIKVPK